MVLISHTIGAPRLAGTRPTIAGGEGPHPAGAGAIDP
jgi:hypothetical protein